MNTYQAYLNAKVASLKAAMASAEVALANKLADAREEALEKGLAVTDAIEYAHRESTDESRAVRDIGRELYEVKSKRC